jgi:hypothetical protein
MRAVLAAVLTVTALALVATAAAARDPKDPQQRHTAADTKLAKTLALKRTDLVAGWKPAKPTPNPPPCTTEPDESKLIQTARIDPTFVWSDGVTTLGSQVDIFKTAAMAQTDWNLSTLKLFRDCLLQSAQHQLPHYTVRVVSAKKLAPPTVSAERLLHYQIVFAITRSGRTLPIVSDVIALGRGRETVVVHSFSVRSPLPSSAVSQVVQLLANRLGTGGI